MRQFLDQINERFQFWLATIPIKKLRESLLEDSALSPSYFALIGSSCLIATLGLIISSAAVIIGAMIIAPLMLPIRGFAFAALEGDSDLLRRSSSAIALGTMIAILFSWLVGLLIGIPEYGPEVLARIKPTLIDLLIALVAGAIGTYAKIKPQLGDALPGTAIAVALMPPLCVVGLTLSQGQWEYSGGAFLLYFTNLLGINLAGTLVYFFAGYTRSTEFSRTLSWAVSTILIALLVIPLALSLQQLIQQAQLEDALQRILVQRPISDRQDIELIKTRILWETEPPAIELIVRAVEPITPDQVETLENTIEAQLGQPFNITFDVTQSTKVKSNRGD
ncbi:MAG: DUF389 domain-containing protein [Cyanobacteria bacterium P01_G01_bin.38]